MIRVAAPESAIRPHATPVAAPYQRTRRESQRSRSASAPRCRCRRAGRPTPSSAGSVRAARVVSSAASATRARPVEVARAAQRRGQHDVGLDGVSRRADSRGAARPHARRARPRPRRRRSPSPVRRDTHASRTGSRARPAAEQTPCRARSSRRGRGEPADAERVGGQPDQRVGSPLPDRRRPPRGPGRPSRGPCRANRADAGTTPCVLCASDASRPDAADAPQTRRGRRRRWRSGPARPRRPRAATAPSGVPAAGSGQRPGVVAEGGVGQRAHQPATLSTARDRGIRSSRYRRARVIV